MLLETSKRKNKEKVNPRYGTVQNVAMKNEPASITFGFMLYNSNPVWMAL